MIASMPDPNNPRPTPDNPNPEPARPPTPPETPNPDEPPGVPPPSPDPIPSPGEEPVQIPPETPPEVPPEVPPRPGFPAPTAVRTSVLAAALLGCLVAVSPTAAQTSGGDTDVTEPTDPCQAQPDDQGDPDDDETDGGDDRADNDRRLALEHCNGVLTPPGTGDQEIEEPAPDAGTTPVIPPEFVPEQPPD